MIAAAIAHRSMNEPHSTAVNAGPGVIIDCEQLSDVERALLRFILSDAPGYVDHPLFHKPSAEAMLFGRRSGSKLKSARARAALVDEDFDWATDSGTLSAQQEKSLFQRYNYARKRAHEILPGQPLGISSDALPELLMWARRATRAREVLAKANVPLVLAMLKRSRLEGLDFDELFSEGSMTLYKAIQKFDCSRGFKFSTYACNAILKSFSRAARKTDRHRRLFSAEFDRTVERSECTHQDEASGLSIEELRDVLAHNRAYLSDLEQTVLRERFAINTLSPSARPKTLGEVGEMVGLTKERIRQVQLKALHKLRVALEGSRLLTVAAE
jgi:RNA polymerase primary sigma factor